MKKRTVTISIRMREDISDLLDSISKEFDITKADFMRYIIETSLLTTNFDDKLSKELKRKISLVMLKHDRTEVTNHLYIIKNMYQRIFDMVMSYRFTTGDINMKVINKVLDMFVNEFYCYPEKDKILIKDEFETAVKNLRNEDYLFDRTEKMKLLTSKGK